MDHPPSDIDVDLSSDAGSDAGIDEAEADQLLQGTKLYGFGSKTHGSGGGRRMDFSPTPSPPPGAAPHSSNNISNAQVEGHVPAVAPSHNNGNILAGSPTQASPAAPPHTAPADPANGNDAASESAPSHREGSVDSTSARQPPSPAVASSSTPSARSRTSIWVHFTRDPDYSTNRRGRCVYCHNYYSCSSGSTGNMWRHIKRTHPEKALQAAPLATHGVQPTPLTKTEATPAAHDSRSRKRQASLSSPTSDHFSTPGPPARPFAQQQQPQQQQQPFSFTPSQTSHNQQQQQQQQPATQRLSINSATRSLEDAIVGELGNAVRSSRLTSSSAADGDLVASAAAAADYDGASTDNLVNALRLLQTFSGRTHSPVDRPASSSQSILLSLLENISAARTSSSVLGDLDHHGPPARPLRNLSGSLGSGGSNGLASIPEDRAILDRHGLPGGSAHYYARSGADVNAESINQFISAVSDAIRANRENSGADSGSQDALKAYVDFMVRDLVPVDRMLSSGMQQLMATVSKDASVPSEQALIGEMRRLRDAKKAELRQRLEAASGKVSVSISTGSMSGTLHYLAVYAHWIDDAFVRHDKLLDWHCVDGAATSGDIISMFESTLTHYGLFARLGTVTTSYTRESVEFLNQAETICHARGVSFDLDRNQSTCISSTLRDAREMLLGSLYGSDSAAQPPSDAASAAAGTPLGKLRALVQGLCTPGKPGSQQLVDLCRRSSIDIGNLIFDANTPWESTVSLLDSTLAVYGDLTEIMAAAHPAEVPALVADDWLWLSQAQMLLHVFDLATDAMAGLPAQFPSIVDAVPIYDSLVDSVQDMLCLGCLHEGIRRLVEGLRDHLMQCHPFQLSPIYRLAPLFDPRLKAT
ncbi:hypothetical protein EV175_005607, partial [Coemansia sp. RSA 1933]